MKTPPKIEVIAPKTSLRSKVRHADFDLDSAEKAANNAMAEFQNVFDEVLTEQIAEFQEIRDLFKDHTSQLPVTKKTERLQFLTHDIKGQASAFGWPSLSAICASFNRHLKPNRAALPAATIVTFLDSILFIYHENIKDDKDSRVKRLIGQLNLLTR